MDGFDADVVIYAAVARNPTGRRVRELLGVDEVADDAEATAIGSVLLLPEVLTKPTREGNTRELAALLPILARLRLLPVDDATARLSVALGGVYGLKAADAVHLATAVNAGADRFITNNRKDFPNSITEIDITYPEGLLA